MKNATIALAIILALALAAGIATAGQVLSKEQRAFLNGRRIAVSRDTKTIPGSVITTWYRNGRPDTKLPAVETNVLKRIVGKEQNNPVQNENVRLVQTNAVLEVSAEKAWKVEKSAAKAAKKDQQNFEKWIKDTKKARDKSSEDMKEFYDSVLELAEQK